MGGYEKCSETAIQLVTAALEDHVDLPCDSQPGAVKAHLASRSEVE